MRARLRKIGVALVAVLLLTFLVTVAYGTSGKSLSADRKVKNPRQSIGKNWEAQEGTIIQKGKPQPIKTLKDTPGSIPDTHIKLMPESSPDKGLEPVNTID
ncbi:MAG: hypothetical protein Q8J63_10000 [Candidatus Aquicultor sp.]|nr:hypothetical protein [Candidatus Aquicultor sp.]